MELSPRISCWTTRMAVLVTFVVLMVHYDNQHNVASASPLPLSGFDDYSEGKGTDSKWFDVNSKQSYFYIKLITTGK